ncbi:Aldo/keto reductase [Lentinus brumalis]|uniref:Aldo/keto reductase n=1 Tax=Lentinus brumalis TaxID=2498619 RepID=A0A371DBT9_9APHY|nr:Aldo/keto reductase [Polyporus brumalis]
MPLGTIKLNDGNEMPVMAFGTGTKWRGKGDITDGVIQAIETGFDHLDSAQAYGTEPYVGRALRDCGLARDEFFITTKWSGMSPMDEAIRSSLDNMGIKQVDLYLVHMPSLLKDVERDWAAFEKIKEAGLAKSIGVSNFRLEDMQKLLKVARTKPAVNQIFLNPYTYEQNKELIEYSRQNGILTEAYSSLISLTWWAGGHVDKPVEAAAKRLNASPAQVLLLWVRSKGVAVVTTSSSKEHLEEYLAIADLPPLTEEEIAAIDEAGAKGPPKRILVKLRENASLVLAVVLLHAIFLLYRFVL